MNWLNFIGLIRTIYGPKLPDIAFIESLGLLAVKIGQTYALRLDFLPEPNCKHLTQLYRHTDSLAPASFKMLLSTTVEKQWQDSFTSIDENPLASASVGQVHRAELKNGESVVVKLIKRDFIASFTRDVRSLRSMLRFVLFFYPKLAKVADPLGILDTIEQGTLDELDLRKEAAGQEILRRITEEKSARFNLSRLFFPKIYTKLSGEQHMVTEFVAGETFDELLTKGKLSYDELLDLFHIHGFFVFCIGTFHGDIHPGNIIRMPDGKFAFIDTGAISRVGDTMRRGLFNFFDALSAYEYDACAQALNSMADRGIEGAAYERFKEKFLVLYKDFTNATVSQVSLTKRMMETIKLGVNSGMIFERGMYPIIKSLMYLDGMVLRCNSQAVLVRDMRKFIDEFKTSMNRERNTATPDRV
ncbi:MAG: AarF/ABC1/UbiB kinase family protein [Chitinivibrionales bacterium]|nr:AarF/ABC1/UbiB kinase family protein [Chitinivibrionales bacterium]